MSKLGGVSIHIERGQAFALQGIPTSKRVSLRKGSNP